jgi:signal transduction histidine kinase
LYWVAAGPVEPETGEAILDQFMKPQADGWSRWLRAAVYAFCAAAFVADLSNDAAWAFGVFYIPLVSTAIYHRDTRAPWLLATMASTMVVIGFFVPRINLEISTSLVNRALSIAAILVTAYLIHHERQIRERLSEQTARAEAADQAKTRLFNNLSHELRTPLSVILGFADLLIADARPDQRIALGHIQSSGKRLLTMLDNLIDLTQLDDRKLRARPVDLLAILAQVVEANGPYAAENEVMLAMTVQESLAPAMADSWALRRIVDNLLANGIKFTEPGGSVTVSTRSAPDGIVVTVEDTGAGMPQHVIEQLGEPFFQADAGLARRFEGMGIGLALSLRLADAMGASLGFRSEPGCGTTASLILAVDTRQASR